MSSVKSALPVSRSLVLLGILLAALNLRPAIASVSPLLEVIRVDTGLSYSAVSLLTTIPVLCMGLFALATPTVIRLVGRERGLFWGVSLIGAATALRLVGDVALVLLLSTVLVGIGIAISQTLLPPLINAYFPDRVAFATGLYTASLAVGAAAATGLTGPVYALSGSWPLALACWAIVAGIALVAWTPVLEADAQRDSRSATTREGVFGDVSWTDRNLWRLIAILGGTNTIFYSTLTWLAPRYVSIGWGESASGLVLTTFLLAQIGGMFLVSAGGDRLATRRVWLGGMVALTALGTTGVALRPELAPFGTAVVFGIGAGGQFALALTLPVDFSASTDAADRLSTVVMFGGYTIGAVGPFLVGVVRDAGGGYAAVFVGMTALCLGLLGISARLPAPGE